MEEEMHSPGSIDSSLPCASVCSGDRLLPRFFSDRTAVISSILIALVIAVSLLAPLLTPYGSDEIDLERIAASPSADHVLGTDEVGRDTFTRLLYGGRFSLAVAFISVAIAAAAGLAVGGAAGYLGGWIDKLACGLVDLFLSVPVFLILLVAAASSHGNLLAIPVVIGGTAWMETARLVRSRFMQLENEEYIRAARSLGVSGGMIVLRHMIPQVLPVVVVSSVTGFANALLVESSLSFLGFGIQPPIPTWGNMLHNAQDLLRMAPAAAFAPGLLIFAVCLAFNFAGNGLKRALARGSE